MRYLLLYVFLVITPGCVTVNPNINCGEKNSIKSTDDDAPSTPINAALPVSVGSTPVANGTVNK